MAAALDDMQKFLNWRKKIADMKSTTEESINTDSQLLSNCITGIETFSKEAFQEYKNSKVHKASAVWQLFSAFTCDEILRLAESLNDPKELLPALTLLIQAMDLSLFCHNLSKSDAELFIISIGSGGDLSAQCPEYAKALSKEKHVEIINFDSFSTEAPQGYLGEMPVNNLKVYRYNAYFGCSNKLFGNAAEQNYIGTFRQILTKTHKKLIFQQFTGPCNVGDIAIQLAQDYPDRVGSQLEIISGYWRNQPVVHYSKSFIDSVRIQRKVFVSCHKKPMKI